MCALCQQLVLFNMQHLHITEVRFEHRRHSCFKVIQGGPRAIASHFHQSTKKCDKGWSPDTWKDSCQSEDGKRSKCQSQRRMFRSFVFSDSSALHACSLFEMRSGHEPLDHSQSVSETCSEDLPYEILSQAANSLKQRAEIPERAVKSTTVVLCCDIQTPTWDKNIPFHSQIYSTTSTQRLI